MAATFGTDLLPPAPPVPFDMSNMSSCGAGVQSEPAVWTYILGVILGLAASLGINIGNNVQALGLSEQAESGEERHTRKFWIGTWTFVFASIINFAAFGLAPVTFP